MIQAIQTEQLVCFRIHNAHGAAQQVQESGHIEGSRNKEKLIQRAVEALDYRTDWQITRKS